MAEHFGLDDEERMSIRVVLDMPPTDNQIHWNNPWGGRSLTTKAKKYKRDVKKHIAKLILKSRATVDFVPDVPYTAIIKIFFKKVEHETWGQKRGAKRRYEKIDPGNRQKLVIDAVMSAIGIDDTHIFREVLVKRCDPDNPRVVVTIREQEPR